nr:uncharacterized protein LOC109157601 [Ipomoea batatas]
MQLTVGFYNHHQDPAGSHVRDEPLSSNQHSFIRKGQNNESSNSLNQVVVSHQSTPPSNPSHEEARLEPSQVSILPDEKSFLSRYMILIAGFWSDICEKLREIPAESVSSFKGSVAKQLQFMKHDAVDLSILEKRVDAFFKKAEHYDKIRSQLSQAMPVETQVAELCLAQGVLKEAQQKLSQTQTLLLEQRKILEDSDEQVILLEEAIKEAEKIIKDSKEKLTKIHNDKPKLQDLVTKAQEQYNTSQEAMIIAEKEVKRIQDTPVLTDEDQDKISLIKKELEVDKKDLQTILFYHKCKNELEEK